MVIRFAGFVLLVAAVGGMFLGTWRGRNDTLAATQHRRVVVGLAADSARAPSAPSPTATPQFDTDRWVQVSIRVRAKEIAATANGSLPVLITAVATAPLPTVLDTPAQVTGTFSITPEGVDHGGCDWVRTDTQRDFKMTVYYTDDLSILASMVSPEWFYTVICGRGAPPLRSPNSGQESLFLFLRSVMDSYLTKEVANGVKLPTIVVSGQGCVKRSSLIEGMAPQAELVQVFVHVYQPDYPGGCNIVLPALPDQIVPLGP